MGLVAQGAKRAETLTIRVHHEMHRMKDINFDFKKLCDRNRDGSYATQRDRARQLSLIGEQLDSLGFRGLRASNLKPKHIEKIVNHWVGQGISAGTIKNRMAALRWVAEKVGKPGVVARSNDYYGIDRRTYVDNEKSYRKADGARNIDLSRVVDPHVRVSLQLQHAFGLRREEAIKFKPEWADRGTQIVLKSSWTKGGKERAIPIRTLLQRDLLEQAKRLVGKGSLIPAHLTYKQQKNIFERECRTIGLSGSHGARHLYAQDRYFELTGWKCPACGGPSSNELGEIRRGVDYVSRLKISRELGHGREQITAVYLGR